jgi:CBS domain-containing protein/anti-sigma regulatory factor (Ser/Thr protein kinase)
MLERSRFSKLRELVYEVKVEDVMTREVVSVEPDCPVRELRELLKNHRISGLPVVQHGELVGIISIEDFIKCLWNGELDAKVAQRMTTSVEVLFADEPVIHAVQKFERSGYGRFPVLDRGTRRLVGILTKGDIISGLLRQLEREYLAREQERAPQKPLFRGLVADSASIRLCYRVAGRDFNRAGAAASALKSTLYRIGIDRDVVRRAAIATYEAEMNIVIFTDGGEIESQITPEAITVLARDQGPGIPDVQKALQPGFSTAPDWVRELGFGAGMGLNNMQKCADRMDIRSQVGRGTEVFMQFAL